LGRGGNGPRPFHRGDECLGSGQLQDPLPVPGRQLEAAKGEYRIAQLDESHLTLRQEATGKEFQIPFTKRLAQPSPPLAEPQLVFDVVGNFVPSYTEYVTDYVVAEVWLPGQDGYLVHTMKGAHQTQTLKGQKAE
jgi:hypothetical protein